MFCIICTCPMSKIDPNRCQNCDYETNWTPEEVEVYKKRYWNPQDVEE